MLVVILYVGLAPRVLEYRISLQHLIWLNTEGLSTDETAIQTLIAKTNRFVALWKDAARVGRYFFKKFWYKNPLQSISSRILMESSITCKCRSLNNLVILSNLIVFLLSVPKLTFRMPFKNKAINQLLRLTRVLILDK